MKKINWQYAIGEIIIVIIGISVAFGLNNWKEQQANEKIKQQYLANIEQDIEKELEHLNSNQERIKQILATIQQIRPFLGTRQTGRDTIMRKVFQIAQLVNFKAENTAYNSMINSGDLKLIDDLKLRRAIEEHYALHELVSQNYFRVENIHERYLGDFFIYQIDHQTMAKGTYDFLDNPLLVNIINSIAGAYRMVQQSNIQCIKSNQKLLETIKSLS